MPTPEFGSSLTGLFRSSAMGPGATIAGNGYVDVLVPVEFARAFPEAMLLVQCPAVGNSNPSLFISHTYVASPTQIGVRWTNPIGGGQSIPAAEYKFVLIA